MDRTQRQADMLTGRLRKNRRRLKSWIKKSGVTCYRLYDRDIPEIPLVIDWYEGRLHVAKFDTVHGKTTSEYEVWVSAMVSAAQEVFQVPDADVFIKTRKKQRRDAQYQHQSDEGAEFDVKEAGLTFRVNLSDYLDTGLFLDHRITREKAAAEAKDKRVLNLFCYTGAFTVHAAAAGATSTTSVDLSRRYLDWAQKNLELNRLDNRSHRFFRADTFMFLGEAKRRGERYDLVIVDPPTFSKSKAAEEFDIQRDHPRLLNAVFEVTAPGGVVYFSTNRRSFDLDEGIIKSLAQCDELTKKTVPPDFKQHQPHHCWRFVLKT